MRMENRCLGAHAGSLNKNLVTRTRNLGAPGDRAPVRQQPWHPSEDLEKTASDKGFIISDNQGSGNCMFHALAGQVSCTSIMGVTMLVFEL